MPIEDDYRPQWSRGHSPNGPSKAFPKQTTTAPITLGAPIAILNSVLKIGHNQNNDLDSPHQLSIMSAIYPITGHPCGWKLNVLIEISFASRWEQKETSISGSRLYYGVHLHNATNNTREVEGGPKTLTRACYRALFDVVNRIRSIDHHACDPRIQNCRRVRWWHVSLIVN